jgi:chromosome partitioning protein
MTKKPMIIAVLNPKGGCGKTTIAINLAHAFKNVGYKTLLVDSDTQRSSTDWYDRTDGKIIPVEHYFKDKTFAMDVERIKNLYDIIIIDGASQVQDLMGTSIQISDFILIPMKASALDAWAVEELITFVKKKTMTSQYNPDNKFCARFVINADRKITKASKTIARDLEPFGIKVLESRTTLKVTYEASLNNGQTVYTCPKKDAFQEIDNIRNEIIEVINDFESKK